MNDQRYNDQDIDLFDLFWRLLEQWRGILVAGIVFALLFSVFFYYRSGQDASSKENQTKINIPTDNSYLQICNVLTQYADHSLAQYNYDNSIYSKNDFEGSSLVICTYRITTKPNTSPSTIAKLYQLITQDTVFTESMVSAAGKYWDGIDDNSLYELLTVTPTVDTNPNSNTAIITITFKLPAGSDQKPWEEALTKAVSAYHDQVTNISDSHTITPLTVNSKKANIASIYKKSNDSYSATLKTKNAYQKSFSELPNSDKNLVKEITEEMDGTVLAEDYIKRLDSKIAEYKEQPDADQDKQEEPAAVERHFSKRYFVFGFLGGMCIYVAVVFFLMFVSKCIRSENDLHNATGVRNFGGIYEYPYTGPVKCFLHDKKVYEFRTRRKKDIASVNDDISSKLSFIDAKHITVISIGTMTDRAEKMGLDQIEFLSSKGFSAESLTITDISSIRDSVFANMDNVLIRLLGNSAKRKELYGTYSKLKEYKVNIIGSEYFEV